VRDDKFFEQFTQLGELKCNFFQIRSRGTLILFFFLFFFGLVVLVISTGSSSLSRFHFGRFDRLGDLLLGQFFRINKIDHQLAQALPAFGVSRVLNQQGGIGSGETRQCVVYLQKAILDALGNGDFAFAREQLHRAHFTHVHTHRVCGAANFSLHRSQGGGGFFCCGIIFGSCSGRIIQDQGIGIRRHFVHGNTHVIDHVDDVFDLFRIDNVIGQVIIYLGIGQKTLLFTLGNEIFQLGLLILVHKIFLRFYLTIVQDHQLGDIKLPADPCLRFLALQNLDQCLPVLLQLQQCCLFIRVQFYNSRRVRNLHFRPLQLDAGHCILKLLRQ